MMKYQNRINPAIFDLPVASSASEIRPAESLQSETGGNALLNPLGRNPLLEARRQGGPRPRNAQLTEQESSLPLIDYPLEIQEQKYRTLGAQRLSVQVAVESEFSPQMDAAITARLVILQAVQAKASRLPKSESNAALDMFAEGRFTYVFLDSHKFGQEAARLARNAKEPTDGPVLVDSQRKHLVVDLQRAFGSADELSSEALGALSKALDVPSHLLQAGMSNGTGGRSLASAMAGVEPVPAYAGRRVSSKTKGADFYKENRHPLINDPAGWLKKNRKSFTHENYFDKPEENVGRRQVDIHRGWIDNRNGRPENSWSAIFGAYENGFMGLEVDVQITKNGKPVLLHDYTAGRMTEDAANRLISSIDSTELLDQNLIIRNPVNGDYVVTDQKVLSVEETLQRMVRETPGMTVTFDCKDNSPENLIIMLIDLAKAGNTEYGKMSAVKLYAGSYPGGFNQLLGNIQKHYQIDPVDPKDAKRRLDLLGSLGAINITPSLNQVVLKQGTLREYFRSADSERAADAGSKPTDDDIAQAGLAWLQSWHAMNLVAVQAVVTHPDAPEGRAMQSIHEKMRAAASTAAQVPFLACYRYEDFSIKKADNSTDFFTWGLWGEINRVDPSEPYEARRGTAGALRLDGEAFLTDQGDEEVWAIGHNETLARGHTGFELDVPLGTKIDQSRNALNTLMRKREYEAKKLRPDKSLIQAVASGRNADESAATAMQHLTAAERDRTAPKATLSATEKIGMVLPTAVVLGAVVKAGYDRARRRGP